VPCDGLGTNGEPRKLLSSSRISGYSTEISDSTREPKGDRIVSDTAAKVKKFCIDAGKSIDTAQRVFFNLVFVALVVALVVFLFSSDDPEIADTTALVVAPKGRLVEQLTGQSVQRMVDEARGAASPETLLKDVVDAIEAGAVDERVQVLVLDLNRFGGARMTKLHDLRDAILAFQSTGKKVIATSDNYEQDGYYLAAYADEVFMHPMGMLILEGFGRYRMYYRDGLGRLGIDVNVFRVGEFKSAVEPYLRDGMSDEARRANLEWLGDLWRVYLEDVAAARELSVEQLEEYTVDFARLIEEAGGDTAEAALDAGLVDAAATRDEVRDRLIELVGEDEDGHSYNRIAYTSYLETLDEDRFGRKAKGDRIGVVVARGTILNGSQPPGAIGGDSTAALIRKARNDDDIKAIVLRVDSGGGSAFASEIIRRECELARSDGKPVVVSMGSVAASGGYWISTASDQIWAYPSTITGSIGIYGMFPTYEKPLAKYLGIRVDGVGTTPLAGVLRPDRELPDEVGTIIQTVIEQGYREFLTRVAESRGMTTEEVNLIARGRVWSGEDAHEIGLVDHLGGLDEALASAAELAGLGEEFEVSYIEKEQEFKERVLAKLLSRALRLTGWNNAVSIPSPADELLRGIASDARDIAALNDPRGVYAHSLIEVD